MPRNWRQIPLETPPRLDPHKGNPARVKHEIHTIAEENNAGLDEVFFNGDRTRAFALIHVFKDTNLDGLDEALGGESEILYTAEELE